MAVLEKGFNYALTPKSIPKLDIVAGVETGLRQVRDAAAVVIARAKVAAILKSAEQPPNNNITQEEEEALKELKRNPEIVVLKTDKGNATVVMDSKDYDQIVNSMLTNEYVNYQVGLIPSIKFLRLLINTFGIYIRTKKLIESVTIICIVPTLFLLDSMANQKSTNQLCLSVLLFRLLILLRTIYQNFCLVFYQVW